MRCTLVLIAACSALPVEAAAAEWVIRDERRHVRSQQLDLTGTLDPSWVGASIWYTVPMLADGFIRPINDSLHLEMGGHFMTLFDAGRRGQATFGLMPLVGPRWSFHLTTQWTAFATVKGGLELLLGERYAPTLDGSMGAYWHTSEDLWVRLEIGARGVLRAGVSLQM